MTHDQIAVYLNEHLEFFNDYPELLHKIRKIDDSDLPLQPLKTLSIADRIIKRAHDDKEHMRSKLEWFVEITQANENIQEHLFEIERAILTSIDLSQMIRQLREEILSRFSIHRVLICLADHSEHCFEASLRGREELNGVLRLVEPETLAGWFPQGTQPTLQSELAKGSEIFAEDGDAVRSQALIPIDLRGEIVGAICLGATEPYHFYDGLRTDYLERMADKLGLAIDNLLLLERLRRQPVLDRQTGLYNASYLEPVLAREFDRARRYEKQLSVIKLHVDTPERPDHTEEDPRHDALLQAVGRILADNSRGGDSMIRTGRNEFLVLLPGLENKAAVHVAERIRAALEKVTFPGPEDASVECRVGVASFSGDTMTSPADLLHTVTRALGQALENGTRLVSL